MDLTEYVRVIRRRLALIIVIIIVAIGGAALALTQTTKQYTSTLQLLVSGHSRNQAFSEEADAQLADERALLFQQVASTGPAISSAEAAARSNSPDITPSSVSVSASASGSDPFLTVTVVSPSPAWAQAVANGYRDSLAQSLRQLGQDPSLPTKALSVVGAANLPTSPSSPKAPVDLGIGALVGLVVGVGSAFVREALDRHVRDAEELERIAGVSLLGQVPIELRGQASPVATHPLSRRAEAYRTVRTNLTFASAKGMPRSVVITSSTSGEGKTTLALNLALACARAGQQVALVDADLRRPMIDSYTGLAKGRGLTDVLTSDLSVDSVLQQIDDGRIDVMLSGPIPNNASELLGSERMLQLLKHLEATHDVVIIDAPPVLPVADALVLGVHAGGVVLVSRVVDATRDRVRRASAAVTKVNAPLVGIVAVGSQSSDSAYYYSYGYSNRGKFGRGKTGPEGPAEPMPEDLRPAVRTPAVVDRASRAAADLDGVSRRDPLSALRRRDPDGESPTGSQP